MAEQEQKQEQNKNSTKKKFSIENLKKADIKHLVKVFTLIWGLVLIILMTITNVGIDKEFNLITWLSNSLIIFGIMVFGLFMGESSGQDKQMKKPDGLYQISLKEYEKYNQSISDELVYFNQFYSQLLPKELKQKKIDYLVVNGVDPAKAEKIVKYCSKRDLEALKSHIFEVKDDDGNLITLIRQLEEYEVGPVEDVLSGYVKLNAANANYFLTAFADSKANDRIVEEGKSLNKERKANKRTNRAIKIIVSLGISLVWGILTVYDFISGDDTQAWVNLISRVTALFTSFFSGWLSSVIDIKLQARILENKLKVLQLFHTSLVKKIFIPKLDDEIAKEELEAYLKKQEEAKKNVVDPEVILPDNNKQKQESNIPLLEEKPVILL